MVCVCVCVGGWGRRGVLQPNLFSAINQIADIFPISNNSTKACPGFWQLVNLEKQ